MAAGKSAQSVSLHLPQSVDANVNPSRFLPESNGNCGVYMSCFETSYMVFILIIFLVVLLPHTFCGLRGGEGRFLNCERYFFALDVLNSVVSESKDSVYAVDRGSSCMKLKEPGSKLHPALVMEVDYPVQSKV